MTDVAAKRGKTAKVVPAKTAAPKPAMAGKAPVAKTPVPAAPEQAPAPIAAESKPVPAPKPAPKPVVEAKPVEIKPEPIAAAAEPEPELVAAPAVITQQESVPESVAATPPVASPTLPTPIAPIGAPTAAKDVMMDTMKTMTDKAQAMFTNDQAKGAIEKGQKMFDEMNSFSKGNIEAIVESSKIAAKGIETMGQDAAAYAKKSFEEASTAVKTMASIKSPTEFMKLQSDYVRSAFDMMVAETSRSTEAMLKLAGEVAQPISNRVALAAEKVKIAA